MSLANHALNYWYLNEIRADFHFEFEIADGQYHRIPAHKSILSMFSDVFRTMFNSPWRQEKSIKILDATIAEFQEFLQFFYLSRVRMSQDNVAKVMYLAQKYDVPDCLRTCEKYITLILSNDNVCWGYDLAIIYNREFLRKCCQSIIAIDTKAVFSSDSFLECSHNTMIGILQMNTLSCSQTEVFEACVAWVKSASHQDELTKEIVEAYLGRSFYEIRFETMTAEEFTALYPLYGELFSFGEYRHLFNEIASNGTNSRNKFEDSPNDKIKYCGRLKSINKYCTCPYDIKSKKTTQFTVTETILLTAFKCDEISTFNDEKCDDAQPTKLIIVETSEMSDKESIVYDGYVNIQPPNGEKVYTKLRLVKPILIQPEFVYEVHMEISPPENDGTLLKSEDEGDSDITV